MKPCEIRVLILAEAANPEWSSVPLVGWSHSRAIQSLVGGHIVTQIRNQSAFERAGVNPSDYTIIDSEAIMHPLYRFASLLRGGENKGWTTVTAIQAVGYPYFEHLVWKKFRKRLKAGEFDLVHRITPLSPTMPSLIAKKLQKLGIPFVMGPLNGGLPWPKDFDFTRRKEKEWLSYVRGAYKALPGFRTTRSCSSAIICGSWATYDQMPEWCKQKCVYIPENGIVPDRFPEPPAKPPLPPLRVAFVGRLVPYKGADMLLEAAAPLVRSGQVVLDIIGDGPEMPLLKQFVHREEITGGVEFTGWIPHESLHERLGRAHVFGFPSVREFGGAVVVEAMALGLVPIVVDYGGPGEIVTPQTGFTIPVGDRASIILKLRDRLRHLIDAPGGLDALSRAGRQRAIEHYTWDAKVRQVREVYRWVLGQRDKPIWPGGEDRDSKRGKSL